MPSIFGESFKITKDKEFQKALIKLIDYLYNHPSDITPCIKSFITQLSERIIDCPTYFLDTINEFIAHLSNSPADELIDLMLTLILDIGTKTILKGTYDQICNIIDFISKNTDSFLDKTELFIEENMLFIVNRIKKSQTESINQIGADRDKEHNTKYDRLIQNIFNKTKKHHKLQRYNLVFGFFMYNITFVFYTHVLKKYPKLLINIIRLIIDNPISQITNNIKDITKHISSNIISVTTDKNIREQVIEYTPKISKSITKASVGIVKWIGLLPITITKDITIVASKKTLTNPIKFAALSTLPLNMTRFNPIQCLLKLKISKKHTQRFNKILQRIFSVLGINIQFKGGSQFRDENISMDKFTNSSVVRTPGLLPEANGTTTKEKPEEEVKETAEEEPKEGPEEEVKETAEEEPEEGPEEEVKETAEEEPEEELEEEPESNDDHDQGTINKDTIDDKEKDDDKETTDDKADKKKDDKKKDDKKKDDDKETTDDKADKKKDDDKKKAGKEKDDKKKDDDKKDDKKKAGKKKIQLNKKKQVKKPSKKTSKKKTTSKKKKPSKKKKLSKKVSKKKRIRVSKRKR